MNYYAVLCLLRPPDLLRCEPRFQGENACKTQENCVSAGGGRHSKSLCHSKLTTPSKFTTAGSFGYGCVGRNENTLFFYRRSVLSTAGCFGKSRSGNHPLSTGLSGTESRIANRTIPRIAGLESPEIPQREAKKRSRIAVK